jgi:hypothetical protein
MTSDNNCAGQAVNFIAFSPVCGAERHADPVIQSSYGDKLPGNINRERPINRANFYVISPGEFGDVISNLVTTLSGTEPKLK